MDTSETTDLVKLDGFTERIQRLPEAYELNTISVQKATAAMDALLVRIQNVGMSEELDKEANDLLAKVRTTVEKMESRRKPYTQLFDEIRKRFTSLENELSQKNSDSRPSFIQKYRDEFAQKILNERRAEEARIQKELEEKKLKAQLQIELEGGIRAGVLNQIESDKKQLQVVYESITIENSQVVQSELENIFSISDGSLTRQLIMQIGETYIKGRFQHQELYQELLRGLLPMVGGSIYDELKNLVKLQIQDYIGVLLRMIPSRLIELQNIANAKADEKLRLIKEAEAREAAKKQREQEEADKAKAELEKTIEAEKQVAYTQTLFEASAEMAETKQEQPQIKFKESLEIVVNNPAGYLALINFWFEKEGIKESVEKLEKKTFGSVKKFCENWANKTGEEIRSTAISYVEVAKTSVKK